MSAIASICVRARGPRGVSATVIALLTGRSMAAAQAELSDRSIKLN